MRSGKRDAQQSFVILGVVLSIAHPHDVRVDGTLPAPSDSQSHWPSRPRPSRYLLSAYSISDLGAIWAVVHARACRPFCASARTDSSSMRQTGSSPDTFMLNGATP